MRSSRLRAQGAPVVSLFAFQDIIAGISGILIVVVLILASEPHRGRADDAEIRSLQTHLDEIQTQQSRISDEINDLERIAASLNDPSAEGRTKQEITELEHETEIQNARSAELDRQLVQAEL